MLYFKESTLEKTDAGDEQCLIKKGSKVVMIHTWTWSKGDHEVPWPRLVVFIAL